MDKKSSIDWLAKELRKKVDNKEISLEEANRQLKNVMSEKSELEVNKNGRR